MYYLSSCSVVKQEDNYIDDFVKIHRALGVEFFLFLDRDGDNLTNRFKDQKDIEVIKFPESAENRHQNAWSKATMHMADKTKWLQYIDIDQVCFPTKTNDIKTFLQDYEFFSCVGLNWHSFGGSNLLTEPNESTYSAYIKRAFNSQPINNHIQTIAQPKRIDPKPWPDPHHPWLPGNELQVNELKQQMPFNSPFNTPPSQENAFIAHYYTRSKEHFQKKLDRKRADTGEAYGPHESYEHHNSYMNEVEDTRIKKFWEKYCS
jgi:hypothetical protein